jgi:hypothetical protein
MDTTLEFAYTALLERPQDVGATLTGRRLIYPIVGGRVEGERLSGELVPGGADWMSLSHGWGRIDVRGTIRTDDGATIYLAYDGLIEMTHDVRAGAETAFEDQYIRCAVRLECGHPEYAWVNHTMFLSRGRMVVGGVAYEVHRVH